MVAIDRMSPGAPALPPSSAPSDAPATAVSGIDPTWFAPTAGRSRHYSSGSSAASSQSTGRACTVSSYVTSLIATPPELPLDLAADPALLPGGFTAGSSGDPLPMPVRHGALTNAVLNLLRPTSPPEEAHDPTSDARLSPTPARALNHALSKESLDVLRAERIARRMANAAQAAMAEESSRVACVVEDADAGGGGTTRRKLKSSRAKHDRVYMPISAPRRAAEGVLPASACEAVPDDGEEEPEEAPPASLAPELDAISESREG